MDPPPPSYSEAVRTDGRYQGAAGDQQVQPVNVPGIRRRFDISKFIVLWTGAGRWYCVCCCLFYVLLTGAGLAIVPIAFFDTPPWTTAVICSLAEVAFILLFLSWCCSVLSIRREGINNRVIPIPIICFWEISLLFFTSVTTGLGIYTYDHEESFVSIYELPLWIAIFMNFHSG